MITEEEWESLKIGDEIYYVYPLSSDICTRKIINISIKKKKTVQLSQDACFLDYNCFTDDYFFINKKEALSHLITKLNINICELKADLKEAQKELELENGN